MINLNDSDNNVTTIQFFDYSRKEQTSENGDFEIVREYSANIIVNERLVIQLSGNDCEAHTAYIPDSNECYYNDEGLQDWASENLDSDDVEAFLKRQGVENNFNYLSENGEKF
mgnify:CR=1 FL=1